MQTRNGPYDTLMTAVYTGDLALAQLCLKNRVQGDASILQAASDLALKKGHYSILYLLKCALHEMKENWKVENQKSLARSQLYDRLIIKFDRDYYFHFVMLEAYVGKQGSVELEIGYRTPLHYPYLRDRLPKEKGREEGQNVVRYRFYLVSEIFAELNDRLARVLSALIQLNKIDGSSIPPNTFAAIEERFKKLLIDAEQGFPDKLYFFRPDYKQATPSPPSSYMGYLMNNAVWELDSDALLALLRQGADTNATYSTGQSILSIAAMQGPNLVSFNSRNKKSQHLLRIIKYLLIYNADVNALSHYEQETITEYLVRSESYARTIEEKELKYEIIKMLTAAKQAKPHIIVHPSLAETNVGKTVIQANTMLVNRTQIKPVVKRFIAAAKWPFEFTLEMKDDALLTCATKQAAKLNTAEYAELFMFFAARCQLSDSTEGKETYFANLLQGHRGIVYVNMLSLHGQIRGMVIYELIYTVLNSKRTAVVYPKVSLSSFNEYPGVMKLVTLIQGFAFLKNHPKEACFTYYEAASAQGFAISSDIRDRYPLLSTLNNAMPNLLATVYGNQDMELCVSNGGCYVKDPFATTRRGQRSSDHTLAAFNQDLYDDVYRRPGQVLSVAFTNDSHSLTDFSEALNTLVGRDCFLQVLDAFAVQQKLQETEQYWFGYGRVCQVVKHLLPNSLFTHRKVAETPPEKPAEFLQARL